MKKLAVLAMAGLISATASAVDWFLITEDHGIAYYIDRDSISSSGKYKIAFAKDIYAPPKTPTPFITIDRAIALHRFDCKSNPKKFQVLAVNAYYDNKVVDSAGYNENSEWNVIYPGTVAEAVALLVCSR